MHYIVIISLGSENDAKLDDLRTNVCRQTNYMIEDIQFVAVILAYFEQSLKENSVISLHIITCTAFMQKELLLTYSE